MKCQHISCKNAIYIHIFKFSIDQIHFSSFLPQKYHEEMLAGSPRRRLFNGYARQLQRRYPSLRDEVQARLQRLNGLWEALEKAICPAQGPLDEAGMIKGME